MVERGVAPARSEWIEMTVDKEKLTETIVSLHAGVRIEFCRAWPGATGLGRRIPHGCVD